MQSITLVLLLTIIPATVLAQTDAAVVKMIRGQAQLVENGQTKNLKLDDTVSVGAIVKTQDKSFARLVFLDKTQLNVGPNSEMTIEKYSNDDSGIISVVKGKIRASVTKDYMDMKNKNQSKMFIKTPDAVLGVRGTDFMVSVAEVATSTVLFEGEIAFSKLDGSGGSSSDLEAMVEKGVRVFPGEFSVVDQQHSSPTVPSLLNVDQLEKLEVNANFDAGRAPSASEGSETSSIAPKGLSGSVIANNQESVLGIDIESAPDKTSPAAQSSVADAMGYAVGDKIKPANGSFLHLDSGVVIPPAANAVLDPVTNTFIAGQGNGQASADGNYQPPANVEISNAGVVTVTSTTSSGQEVKTTVNLPPPVASNGATSVSSFAAPTATSASSNVPVWDPVLNRPSPSGGIQGTNDPQRDPGGGFTDVTLRVQ